MEVVEAIVLTSTLPLSKRLDMQPEVLSEGKLVDINEESGCKENDEGVPEEVMLAKYSTLKKTSQIFHYIESTENKLLEAGPNLERSMLIYKGKRKMPVP